MIRFILIFAATLVIALLVMAGMLAQNGFSLFDRQMQTMLAVCLVVALYVAWRINYVLRRREERQAEAGGPSGERKGGGLGSVFGGKSRAQLEREAQFEAKKRRLISEGKIAAEDVGVGPETQEAEPQRQTETPSLGGAPTRVPASASVKDKMAARRERVRRAREEGKI